MSRAPGGAVLAAAGIAAEYGGELYPRLPSEVLDAAPGRRGRDLGDVGERAHDVVGDARPQPRRGDDDGEEHHGGEERPGAAWARSSFGWAMATGS